MASFDVSYVDGLIKIAQDTHDMTVHTRDSADYETTRQVHNSRLQTRPYAIVECRHAQDFSFWLKGLEGQDIPISLRSGGHHHEAMSSNDGGIVLMSNPDVEMRVDTDRKHVWLGAGNRLGKVIAHLAESGRILPTGGCATVCVAGLTHGGGWGMSYRTFGATVDALRAVEMVLPNGDIIVIGETGLLKGSTSLDINPSELFWAIRGGGGGNFGAVTRFRFEIFKPEPVYTEFTLQWHLGKRQQAALAWTELCEKADERLNTFARMTVVGKPDEFNMRNPPFLVGGRFYGTSTACKEALAPLLETAPPNFSWYRETLFGAGDTYLNAFLNFTGPAPMVDNEELPPQAYALQIGAPGDHGAADTCSDLAQPHKVSSAMPSADPAAVIEAVARHVDLSPAREGVNMYVSFHGMGGNPKTANRATAFPWRHKDYMLQAQAWWNPKDLRGDEQEILDWVDGFRQRLEPLRDGAFINFPDRKQNVELFYGPSWDRLQAVKTAVDPDNRLKFELGIPPA